MSGSFATHSLHLLLLAGLATLATVVVLVLTLRARAEDRRNPWHWALHRSAPLVATGTRWLRRIGLRSAAAIGGSALALGAFAGVAEDVRETPTLGFDERVRTLAQAGRTPVLDHVFLAITWLGTTVVLTVIVVATAAIIAWRRSRRTALLAMGAPFAGALAILGFKHFFQRERPIGALALGIHTYAFPSGHATASAASLLTLAYVLARERMAPWWTVPLAALLVLLIGFSRVYLDAHWATDVAGGWAVGSGLALAGVALYERLRMRDRARRAEHDAREAAADEGRDVPAA